MRWSVRKLAVLALAVAAGAPSVLAQAPPAPAAAQPAAGVIELFTSQGCSSCPPADALLGEYAKRSDLVALTMPVDYWDYLGWRDTLAAPAFSQRQRAYAKTRGDGLVYTPQVVVNGLVHASGSKAADIDRAVARTTAQLAPRRVPLKAWTDAGKVHIETGQAADGAPAAEGTIWVATVEKQVAIAVKHGENRGKSLTYYNVVRQLTPAGMWSSKAGTVTKLQQTTVIDKPSQRCAVLLQQGAGGPIVAATWVAAP